MREQYLLVVTDTVYIQTQGSGGREKRKNEYCT